MRILNERKGCRYDSGRMVCRQEGPEPLSDRTCTRHDKRDRAIATQDGRPCVRSWTPPDVAWDDLLQEALTRIISGARRQPEGVPIVAFVAGIMRSLKAEHWRRVKRSGGHEMLRLDRAGNASREVDLRDPAPGPERSLSAQQELAAIERLFAGDHVVLKIIAAMGQGLSAEQISIAIGISKIDYYSARKRMRRALLREGLTCEPK